jgi:hypothetical protein
MEAFMFRLLKLSAYVLLGYAIYEFVSGLLQIEDERYRRSAQGPLTSDAAKANFNAPAHGETVSTSAPDGSTASYRVGA